MEWCDLHTELRTKIVPTIIIIGKATELLDLDPSFDLVDPFCPSIDPLSLRTPYLLLLTLRQRHRSLSRLTFFFISRNPLPPLKLEDHHSLSTQVKQ